MKLNGRSSSSIEIAQVLCDEKLLGAVLGPYLKPFLRETKPGRDCWSDQSSLFDRGPVATHRQQVSRLVDASP